MLPLARLEDMLANDKKGLKDLLTTLRKEKVTASAAAEEEEAEEEDEEPDEQAEDTEATAEAVVEVERRPMTNAREAASISTPWSRPKRWAKEAVVLAGLVQKAGQEGARQSSTRRASKPRRTSSSSGSIATGEFYLVRAGQHSQGHRHFLHPPATGRADRSPDLGAAVLRQGREGMAR